MKSNTLTNYMHSLEVATEVPDGGEMQLELALDPHLYGPDWQIYQDALNIAMISAAALNTGLTQLGYVPWPGKTAVVDTDNSWSWDYAHPDDEGHLLPLYDTPPTKVTIRWLAANMVTEATPRVGAVPGRVAPQEVIIDSWGNVLDTSMFRNGQNAVQKYNSQSWLSRMAEDMRSLKAVGMTFIVGASLVGLAAMFVFVMWKGDAAVKAIASAAYRFGQAIGVLAGSLVKGAAQGFWDAAGPVVAIGAAAVASVLVVKLVKSRRLV